MKYMMIQHLDLIGRPIGRVKIVDVRTGHKMNTDQIARTVAFGNTKEETIQSYWKQRQQR